MVSRHPVFRTFLGKAPERYNSFILEFLIINLLIYWFISPSVAGRLLVAEFMFTLLTALKCYLLQPGGLPAAEAVVTGMTAPHHVKQAIIADFNVI